MSGWRKVAVETRSMKRMKILKKNMLLALMVAGSVAVFGIPE